MIRLDAFWKCAVHIFALSLIIFLFPKQFLILPYIRLFIWVTLKYGGLLLSSSWRFRSRRSIS